MNLLLRVGGKAHIAVGQDADQAAGVVAARAAVFDHGNSGNPVCLHQIMRIGKRCVGADRHRIDDHEKTLDFARHQNGALPGGFQNCRSRGNRGLACRRRWHELNRRNQVRGIERVNNQATVRVIKSLCETARQQGRCRTRNDSFGHRETVEIAKDRSFYGHRFRRVFLDIDRSVDRLLKISAGRNAIADRSDILTIQKTEFVQLLSRLFDGRLRCPGYRGVPVVDLYLKTAPGE